MKEIGKRAMKAICERAEKNGTTPEVECSYMGLEQTTYKHWGTKSNPCAYFLQQMALNDYDVHWILTGERQ